MNVRDAYISLFKCRCCRLFKPDPSFDIYSRLTSIENRLDGIDNRLNAIIFVGLSFIAYNKFSMIAMPGLKYKELEQRNDKQRTEYEELLIAMEKRMDLKRDEDKEMMKMQRSDDRAFLLKTQGITFVVALISLVMSLLSAKK